METNISQTDNPTPSIKIFIEENLNTLEVQKFATTCAEMINLYAKKNHDYGNAFVKGMNDIGVAYGIGRLYDKMNRIITLTKVKAEINDESIKDTLIDLACYSVMTLNYLKSISSTGELT